MSLGTVRLRCASCVGRSPHQHGLLVDFIHQRDHAHGGAHIRECTVAQPCIHAGRVERGAAEREDEREHVQASAFARKKETDARMRTPLARQAYECHARVLQYGMKSAGYAPPCIWVQLLRTLGRVVHTPNGDTDVHGEPLACRCARTAPPPSCRHRAATCTATAAHRRPPPASVLSSVCR